MSEKETMIRLEGIKKRFRTKAGELEVLHGVSADIKKGEVFGIIGLSGAGKSWFAASTFWNAPQPVRFGSMAWS